MVLGGENAFGIASLSNRDSFFGNQPVLSQVHESIIRYRYALA